MKGFIIYETPGWGDEDNVVYTQEVNNASYTLKQVDSDPITCYFEGIVTNDPVTKATCNESDTYDFETGALIALMKKCGREKSLKAVEELYSLYEPKGCDLDGDIFKNELQETTDCLNDLSKRYDEVVRHCDILRESNKSLQEKTGCLNMSITAKGILNNKLLEENSNLKYIKSCNESAIKSLENTRDLLKAENEELKSDKDKSWKNYQRKIQKKQDRINELEAQIKRINELESYNNQLEDEVKIVREAYDMCEHKYQDLKAKKVDLVYANYKLKVENEKLKTDCEKLQHGYIDTDMIFCGGRQNGKQYTALVELFKKIDQKKVDAAYKEAYNTTLPLWQKEFLNSLYGSHKESKEKTELPRTLDINGVKYREVDKRDRLTQPETFSFEAEYIDTDALEALRGFRPTKREKMWDEILKEGRTPVYVKREDIHDFLKECQVTGIKWVSGRMPLETMPFHMSDGYDGAYFFVMTSLDISKSKRGAKEFRNVMSWWMTASDEEARNSVKYIRPMRWDLFAKGRLVVKVNKDNYSEFCGAVLSHFDKVGISAFNHAVKFGYYAFNKDTDYVERLLIFDYGDVKEINRHKVVDWEDVR